MSTDDDHLLQYSYYYYLVLLPATTSTTTSPAVPACASTSETSRSDAQKDAVQYISQWYQIEETSAASVRAGGIIWHSECTLSSPLVSCGGVSRALTSTQHGPHLSRGAYTRRVTLCIQGGMW